MLATCIFFRSRSISDCGWRRQTMGLERKKAVYDICVEYGAVSSSRWAHLDLIF